MKTTTFLASLSITLASASGALAATENPASGDSPEKVAVQKLDREYEAAYAKGDAAALAGFFAEDAENITEEGNVLRGRAEIEQSLSKGLKANKGAKLSIELESVRLLTPEVAVEKGLSTVTAKDGEASTSRYTAVYVKKEGKWKISQLVESAVPATTPQEHLSELAWMIGNWEESDKNNDLKVSSQYVWSRGGNFITRNVKVERAGNVTLEGWQIIGWDPIQERLRTWTFDSEGGYADGYFTRDGDRWLLRETGVTPDGSRTSADNTITKLSADRITWESNNRTLDGDPQPGIGRIEINRVKGN